MPRVLVIDDQGGLTWCERVRADDFETEHFRRCLNDRLRWAVGDAEACGRAAAIPPLQIRSATRPAEPDLEPV